MVAAIFDETHIAQAALDDLVQIVPGAIVTIPLINTGPMQQMLFAMDRGQLLNEHRAASLATIQVLAGRLRFNAAGTDYDMTAGDWLIIPTGSNHSAEAIEPVKFLLTLARHANGKST